MPLKRPDFAAFAAGAKRTYSNLGPYRRGIAAVAALILVLAAAVTVQAGRFACDVFAGLPGRAEMQQMGRMAQATTLFDRNGDPAFSLSKEQRIEVRLDSVSPDVIDALIAVEDQRFYKHQGFDPVRLVAAAWANFREGRRAQGASTITQQLARQAFLTPDKTVRRKLREIVLASRIERLFTKREILELYLNKVYFGDGLYGIEAAARGYFGRHASDLTLAQAALLAGLVQSPSSYAPTVNRERAVARRNVVLQAMFETKVIDRAEFEQARAETVALRYGLRREEPWGLYFKEHVRRELVRRFGLQEVYEGGLRVYTSIDAKLQQQAEGAIQQALQNLEERRRKEHRQRKGAAGPEEEPLEAALVALDPQTGEVRAMVGGRSFEQSRFNRATQARRQPGSAFKPLVYAAALESGYTPATLLDGLNDPVLTPEGEWVPEDEHLESSTMTIRTALRTSSNRAAVRMLQAVGITRAVDYAERMGLGTVPSVPSLALGSGEVTLLSLSAAYVPFANGGLSRTPILIKRVVGRDGKVLLETKPSGERVVSEQTAFLMSNMLADVINGGTAYRARVLGFRLPAAGKTGTTNEYQDAWFIGYTPGLLTGVWVGFDQPRPIMRDGYAGDVAVPLWARFMADATKDDKPSWYKVPRGLTGLRVCRLSGARATAGCDHVPVLNDEGEFEDKSYSYTEYFVRGSEPIGYCPLHDQQFVFGDPTDLPNARVIAGGVAPRTAPPNARRSEPDEPGPGESSSARAEEPKKKKKGFWGRLFGVFKGGDDKDDKKPKTERKDDKGGGGEGRPEKDEPGGTKDENSRR
jgi:penicillin-binding protein 1A